MAYHSMPAGFWERVLGSMRLRTFLPSHPIDRFLRITNMIVASYTFSLIQYQMFRK